ncbi:MAG: nuclear transport factor 2 family protein [Deltaproteobacteria bacterium]|nr:nuclear transport factor 2 family protein [Deltaproteobacteria bacterium]
MAGAVVVGSVGCGGGGGSSKPKPVMGPAVDEKTAQKDAAGLVEEIYETLGRGNKDSLFTLLVDSLVVFGPRGKDSMTTRADVLVALGEVVDPKAKKRVELRSGSLEVVASPGGRSAWAFDVININGEPHAVMAILTNSDDLWLVEAVSVAHTPSKGTVKTELAKDAVVPPGSSGPKQSADGAEGAVEKFRKGLLAQDLWGDDLGSRSDAVFVGPAAGEVTRGKKELKKLWKKRVEMKTRAAASGEITAAVTADGQLAWVSAPITRVAEEQDPLPLRAFAVFEKTAESWTLIALQESLAVDAPGAGAAFKKIVPPALEEKPPEVVEAPKPDQKADKKKSKSKKKKKKKPVDDDE